MSLERSSSHCHARNTRSATNPPNRRGSFAPAVYVRALSVPDQVNANIEAIAGHKGRAERVTIHQRGIERLTEALGRPWFFYATIAFVVGWITVNLDLPPLRLAAFDPPPFHYLHILVTLSALLMATVVLVTQNRQIRLAERHSHLDLQINLQAEGKIAKAIALIEELRRDLPNVRDRSDSEAHAMSVRTDPQIVLEALEESIRAETDADKRVADVAHGKPSRQAP